MMQQLIALVVAALVVAPLGSSRADEPRCQQEYVLRMGKLFTPEVFENPSFDPDNSPYSPFCAGDVLPTPDLLKLIDDSRQLRLLRKELSLLRESTNIELESCTADRDAVYAKWVACEETVCPIPPPVEVMVEPPWYLSPVVWGTVGLLLGGLAGYGLAELTQ